MLFCSHVFVFAFLPLVLAGYFAIGRVARAEWTRAWLVLASLVFYAWNRVDYLWIILSSIAVNYACVFVMERGWPWSKSGMPPQWQRRLVMWVGVLFNIGLLGWFKYAMFVLENVNDAFGTDYVIRKIILPLGISFFTFQQIACLVDLCKSRETPKYTLLNYTLFVTFFPQLVAGPIVHHHDMMPQFEKRDSVRPDGLNLAAGLHLFAVGLFKKLVIADFVGKWAANGMDKWDRLPELTFWQAWFSVVSYMLQIYFDFSAYSDMAIGLGRMFNIRLPLNFNSPYRARNIKEFWQRWHMTLGSFLMNYLYIPLGGSRRGAARAYANLFLVFLVCGVWHAASWSYVLFGALHGAAMVVHRAWGNRGFRMPVWLAWPLTFVFLAFTYAPARCPKLYQVFRVWRGMFTPSSFNLQSVAKITQPVDWPWLWLAAVFALAVFIPNAAGRDKNFRPTLANGVATVLLLAVAVLHVERLSPFLYFNF
ncbi:MAG: MBOAT family protein [Kiritimatiellaeota bacterium]|nr:MBOAT family protein [Kiritimatiellota bacterium]